MIEQQTFNNRYKLDRKLGEGGMATVYSGTDTVLRRRVAIKVLRPQYAADDEFVRRFYQEAESAARLSHPNIVNTYDVGREDDTYYIVMELVDGPSLAEIIAADRKLPEPVAIDYAAQICNGLAFAHRAGLLHRDVKPANILVTKDDVVKLSDFGIARAVSQHTMTLTKPGLVMGSVYYISPEQAQGHELHEASDLYSVGVVLYQMIAGELPYGGESPVTVALKHIGDPVPTLDGRALNVSPALSAIVNKLLQKKPGNRFQSASEVATALREARERPSHAAYSIADDAPTQVFGAVPPPRRSPMPDHSYTSLGEDEERRSRLGSGAISVLIALAVVATIVGYLLFGRPLPDFKASISVPDYSNMSDAAAQQAVVNAGLQAREIKTSSDTVAANHVIRQNPAAGSKVEKNSLVELFVSNGLPLVGLRDVRGYNAADAARTLADDKFKVKQSRTYNDAPKDSVVDQQPKPGAQMRQGSTVSLVVSNGPQPIQAPNFVGMNVADAVVLAKRSGISLDTSTRESVAGVANDVVAAQDIAPGQQIERTTTIRATISSGAGDNPVRNAAVPNVVNMKYADAIAQLGQGGFGAAVHFVVQAEANGLIVAQDPAPNTQSTTGANVSVILSVSGEVPDTNGLSLADAQAALEQNGYKIGKFIYTTTAGADGKVVGTQPEVGTNLTPGSTVTVVVNGVQH